MKKLLTKAAGKAYNIVKSNKYLSSLYYSAANSSYFGSMLEHEKMLADKARMSSYHEAITNAVKKNDIVVDLGTGTGILAFFASKKSPKKVYAIDHGSIIETAKKIASHNKIKNVEFVSVHSKSFNIPEKADIVIHEQIGAFLFDENMVENLTDLRDRILKKGGRILPGKFEVFIEPVKLKDTDYVPFIWEQDIFGIKYDCFKDPENKEPVTTGYGALYARPGSIETFLSEPEKAFFIDLEKSNEKDIPRELTFERKITKSGRLDGLCFYFNIIFDEETILSTDPFVSTTHWNVPVLRTEGIEVKKDDVLKYRFRWDNPADVGTYSWELLS